MNSTKPKPDVWTISLRAEGSGPPVEIRVRRFLKSALRAYGLRCIRVSEAEAEPTTPTQTPAEDHDHEQ